MIAAEKVTPPTVVVYRSFDEPTTAYPYPIADAKVKDFEEWLSDLSIPIIDEVSGENFNVYAASGKPLAYLFLDPADEKKEEHIAMIKPVAATFKSKVNFVWIDAIKFSDHGKALNLVENKWPSFVLQDLEKQLKYPFSQAKDVTPEAVTELVNSFLDGKLEPQLKSEAIPETQDGPVFTLVGKQLEEIVFDDSKDVMVEFYAPWSASSSQFQITS